MRNKRKWIAMIALAALLPGFLFAGCAKKEPNSVAGWQEDTQIGEAPYYTVDPWENYTLDESTQEETGPEESTGPTQAVSTSKAATQPTNNANSTAKTTTTTKNANTTTTTTKAGNTTTTTTTSTTTTTTTTTKSAGTIAIASKEAALAAFNSAVKKAVDSKAGFGKSHLVTPKDWKIDLDWLGIPELPLIGPWEPYLTEWLNTALFRPIPTVTAQKGSANSLIKTPTWTMSDMKDVSYSQTGSLWTVTLDVKDGRTRQEKRLLTSGITGDSPIDRGPLDLATGGAGLYDHIRANHIFAQVKQLTVIAADPIEPPDLHLTPDGPAMAIVYGQLGTGQWA